MKILYVTDLDGTLLNSRSQISPFSLTVINELVEQGMLFTYATARSLISARDVTSGLSARIPVIGYNGAFIFDQDGKVMSSCCFSRSEREDIASLLEEHQIRPLVYALIDGEQKVSWITGGEHYGVLHYLSKRKNDPRMRPLCQKDRLYEGEIFYFTCIGEKETLQPVYQLLKEDPRFHCTLQQEIYRTEYWLEIMPKAATKANAVKRMRELWNCERVVCFGDAVNDLPMFSVCEEGYAVENAVEQLKQAAAGIIPSNDQDGVAKWLLEHAQFSGKREDAVWEKWKRLSGNF